MAEDDLMTAALATQADEQKRSKEVEKESPEASPEEAPSHEEETPVEAPAEPEADEQAADESAAEDASATEPKKTRGERREERKQRFEFLKQQQPQEDAPKYNPLQFEQAPEEGFDPQTLVEDRENYAKSKAAEAAKVTEVNSFWRDVSTQHKLLVSNPKFSFLDQSNPETFDQDKADTLNGLYLRMVGHNPQTNMVRDTSIPYSDFVESMVSTMEDWAGEREAAAVKAVAQQKSQAGVRPTGATRRSTTITRPKDVGNLSDEEFSKAAPEILEQAISQLGQ